MKDWRFIFEKHVLRRTPIRPAEPLVAERMKKIRGKTFVDIGCNQKFYSNYLRKNFKDVITIDPNPKWEAEFRIALSDYNGEAPFYIGLNDGSFDSLVHIPHILGKDCLNGYEGSFFVQVRRFDSLGISADLAKIDVEGAEFEVIKGMVGSLPRNLMVELHDERRQTELIQLMIFVGYLVSQVDATHFFGELKR